MLKLINPPPLPPKQPEESIIETGTVVSWDKNTGTGRILADKDDHALFVHQVDLVFTGEGKRSLPLWHQVEYRRSSVNGGEVACRVSKTLGRSFHYEAVKEEQTTKPLPVPAKQPEAKDKAAKASTSATLPGPDGEVRNILHEKLNQYKCCVITNETISPGKMYYFHGEYRYGVIIPDIDTDKRIFADASAFLVSGSFLNVRKGICVEFMTGKNMEGKEVAINVTGPQRQPITHETRVESLTPHKRKKGGPLRGNPAKRLKQSDLSKPIIPDGKNPISIFYEFANSCNPKRIPSIKLVSQNTRTTGMVADFTFEARLDDKPIAQGRAKTKKDAKTYAAYYALEALNKESGSFKQEIQRIKKGIPSVKKQMRNFTKRKWRPGPGVGTSGFKRTMAGSGATTLASKTIGNNVGTFQMGVQALNLGAASYVYQPTTLVVPQISPAVSLTTYNPVNNTTSTSYMNQETANKFAKKEVQHTTQATTATPYYQYNTAVAQRAAAATTNQFTYTNQGQISYQPQATAQTTTTSTQQGQSTYPWQVPTTTYVQQPQQVSYQTQNTYQQATQ